MIQSTLGLPPDSWLDAQKETLSNRHELASRYRLTAGIKASNGCPRNTTYDWRPAGEFVQGWGSPEREPQAGLYHVSGPSGALTIA